MTQRDHHNSSQEDDCLFSMDHLYEAALGILEPDDRNRLEHHLAECDVCRAELADLDAAVGLLPLSVDQIDPPADLKGKLQQRLTSELTTPKESVAGDAHIAPLASPATSTRRPFWAFGSIAAGLLVAVLAIATWNYLPIGNDGNTPQGQMSVLAMETNDGCADCHEDTRGHIGANLEQKDSMVVAWNLDPDQKHEVWCVNKQGERLKVGELQVDADGTAMQTMSFPDAVGAYDQIYVARNDGTEELSVAPNKLKSNDVPAGTPPE